MVVSGPRNEHAIAFEIKKKTELREVLLAYCERTSKDWRRTRFVFDGVRVQYNDTPELVSQSPGVVWSDRY